TSSTWTDPFGPWAVHVYTDKRFSRVKNDFDGDGRTDIAIYNPNNGQVKVLTSTTGFAKARYYETNIINGIPISGDYDGDGKADVAVYNPSTGMVTAWLSGTNYQDSIEVQLYGNAEPFSGDFDGDGRTDLGVKVGQWFDLKTSSSGYSSWWSFDLVY